MTREDLDRLAALVAASDRRSPLPWYDDGEDLLSSDDGWVCARPQSRVDAEAIIALRNAAADLLALAREALEARERYRLERSFRSEAWEPLHGGWSGIPGIDAARMARGWCAESHGFGWSIRIVRERDGEVVE